MRRILTVLFFTFTFLSNQIFAEELSLSEIKKYAAEGDATAQNNLGVMYYNGEGVDQDYQQAFNWYKKAADQDFAEAQYNLSQLYLDRKGANQNYTQDEAKQAPQQTKAGALSQLLLEEQLYLDQKGANQKYTQAKNLLEKAAKQDFAAAQNQLGSMYENGEGVRQDYAQAKKWFSKACDNGSQNGCDKYKELNLK